MHAILALALLSQPEPRAETVHVPIAETAAENSILSAHGPLAGSGAMSFGFSYIGPISARGISATALPVFEFRWLHGLTDHLHTDLQIRTIGFLTSAEIGLRFRPLEMDYVSLALEIDVHGAAALAVGADGFATFIGGFGGAVLLSFGPTWLQGTASFAARGTFLDGQANLVPSTEASIGVEFPLSRSLNAFFEGALFTLVVPGSDVHVPIISHGLAF